MDVDAEVAKTGALAGVLLAAFFVAGFTAHSVVAPSTPTAMAGASGEQASQQEALQKAQDFLTSDQGPFRFPFTYNVTTAEVTSDTRVPGTTFYNWTVAYTVEPVSGVLGENPLYSVPEGRNSTVKTLNLYVSRDGGFIFRNPPIPTGGQ